MEKELQLNHGKLFITLGQLLQLEGLAYSGGSVKAYLDAYHVFVNNEEEDRRGRKLYAGDVITFDDGNQIRIVGN